MSLLVDIQKSFGKFKLNASFETAGGVTGLLGASGCGKSITLKCIAGIETPDAGRIVLDGRILFDSTRRIDLPPQKRQVGYLFQHYALFPNMTVAQNIAAGVRERSARRGAVAELARAFQLEGMEGKYPRQLSGGQQQRVALARILAGRPSALLLDEPFSALDSYLKWQVELELMDLLERFAGPVLFVTHDRDEVHRVCKSVCVLDHGRSQPLQPMEHLFDAPRTVSSCLLSGCKNLSRAKDAGDGWVEALDWGVKLRCAQSLPTGLSHVGVRSHALRIVDGPGENRLCCPVERVVEEVFSTVVLLSTTGGSRGASRLRIELPREDWAALAAPASLWLELPPAAILPLTGPAAP